MTTEEYLEWLSLNDWINLKRIIQTGLDEGYKHMKNFGYPKMDARVVFDYFVKSYHNDNN
jgi:hypothetical protein